MAQLSTKKSALFAQSGDVLPVPPSSFIETTEPVIITPEFTSVDINRLDGKMNSSDSIVDTCNVKTSFEAKTNMRSNNVAADALDTPPEYGLLLKCAGFDEVIDTATPSEETVTYTNNNVSVPACSAITYLDGRKHTMEGSLVSDTTIGLTVGEPATITNAFSGYLDSAEGIAEANPAVTLTDEPVLIVSCADVITLDGTCIPVKTATIKMENETSELYTMGGACGLKKNEVTDYKLTLELVFYVDSATYDRDAALIEAGLAKVVVIKLGLDDTSTEINGKSVVITCDLAKATTYADSDADNLLSRTLTMRLMDGTNPAVSIANGFFL